MLLAKANQLEFDLAAVIALPGNPVQTAIEVYGDFNDVQKESAFYNSRDLLEKAIELQDTIRRNHYLMDGVRSDFKISLRYLGIDYLETIDGSTLLTILKNKIAKEEEELKEWMCY